MRYLPTAQDDKDDDGGDRSATNEDEQVFGVVQDGARGGIFFSPSSLPSHSSLDRPPPQSKDDNDDEGDDEDDGEDDDDYDDDDFTSRNPLLHCTSQDHREPNPGRPTTNTGLGGCLPAPQRPIRNEAWYWCWFHL